MLGDYGRTLTDHPEKEIGIGFGLILFGIVTAIVQLKPSGPSQGIFPGWRTEFELNHFLNVLNILPKAFLPIPEFTLRFWNTYLLDRLPAAHEVKCVLAVLILLFALFLFIRKPLAFLMYLFGNYWPLGFVLLKTLRIYTSLGFSLHGVYRCKLAVPLLPGLTEAEIQPV